MTILDIDIKTLLFFLFVANFVEAIIFAAYRFGAKENPDVFDTLFLLGKLGQSSAWLLICLRGSVSAGLSLVAGNIFLVAGQAAECFALSSLTKISRKMWAWIFGSLVLLSSAVCLTLIDPVGMEARLAFVSVFQVIFFSVTGWVFLFLPRNSTWLTWLMGVFYSASAYGLFGRALCLIQSNQPYSVFSPENGQLLAMVLLSLVMFIGNIGYILVKKDALDRRLFQMATHDSLTGIFNRGAFEREAQRFWALARRNGTPLSLLMIDLDHFKEINDSCGHPVGDRILQDVVEVVGGCLRPYDVLGRYGGEEFTVLLPATGLFDAESVAERIRQNVDNYVGREEGSLNCTISIGVASCRPGREGTTFDDLICFSDDALYEAKRLGRNRVVAFPEKHEMERALQDLEMGCERSSVFKT